MHKPGLYRWYQAFNANIESGMTLVTIPTQDLNDAMQYAVIAHQKLAEAEDKIRILKHNLHDAEKRASKNADNLMKSFSGQLSEELKSSLYTTAVVERKQRSARTMLEASRELAEAKEHEFESLLARIHVLEFELGLKHIGIFHPSHKRKRKQAEDEKDD